MKNDILIHPFTALIIRPTCEVRVAGSCWHLEAVLLTQYTAVQRVYLHTAVSTADKVDRLLHQLTNISNRIGWWRRLQQRLVRVCGNQSTFWWRPNSKQPQ